MHHAAFRTTDSLVLSRCSYGEAKRWVSLRRPLTVPVIGSTLPVHVRYLGYLSVDGPGIDLLALQQHGAVEEADKGHRRRRDGAPHHITLVSPPEMQACCVSNTPPQACLTLCDTFQCMHGGRQC